MSAACHVSFSPPAQRALVACALACSCMLGSAAWGQALDASVSTANAAVTAVVVLTSADEQRPEIRGVLPQHRLVGKGRLTFWGFPVYDARLWAAPGFKADNLAAQPFALELDYLRGFHNEDVAQKSIAEMRRASTISEAQAKIWTQELLRVLPDTKKGDRVTGVNRPGIGAAFWVNGKPSGEIVDVEFARLFFGIWLSPTTSEPKLRSALLGGAG